MTYDSRERMNAEQEEATPSYRQISYDPYTQIERYHGEMTDAVNSAYETAGGAGLGPAHTPGLDELDRRDDVTKYELGAELGRRDDVTKYELGAELDRRDDMTKYELGAELDHRDDVTKYELGAELAPPLRAPIVGDVKGRVEKPGEQATGSGFGLTGISLSVLSLFILPYLTAPIGIILGYMAYRRDARTLGMWSMILGAVSIIGAMVIYPYMVAK